MNVTTQCQTCGGGTGQSRACDCALRKQLGRVNIIGPHVPPVMCTVECTKADEKEVRRRMEQDGWQTLISELAGDSCTYTFSRGKPELLNAQHCHLRELLA